MGFPSHFCEEFPKINPVFYELFSKTQAAQQYLTLKSAYQDWPYRLGGGIIFVESVWILTAL